jgi:hypothetical protein
MIVEAFRHGAASGQLIPLPFCFSHATRTYPLLEETRLLTFDFGQGPELFAVDWVAQYDYTAVLTPCDE